MVNSYESEHCDAAEILEDLEGRTSADRHAAIRNHVERCAPCNELRAHIVTLREDIAVSHARHIRPERLVVLAESLDAVPSAEEEAHLKACGLCRAQLAELARLPAPLDPTPAPRRRFRLPRLAWGLAGAAALLLLFVAVQAPNDAGTHYAALAQIAPIEITAVRDSGAETGFAARYQRGLQLYTTGDYVGARSELRAAVELDAEHPVALLLLGSAELLTHRPAEAQPWLLRAAEFAPDVAIRDEALWQLVNAHLLRGEVTSARARCEELETLGLLHDADARKVLTALRALEGE